MRYTQKTHPKLRNSWRGMRDRCLSKNNKAYKWYGGKGITVYEGWKKFHDFAVWALANGYEDGLTIERIDSNGNYGPSNCKWISHKDTTIDGNSYRYREVYEKAYHHWMKTRCTGKELADFVDRSFSMTCRWIRGWKANNLKMLEPGNVSNV